MTNSLSEMEPATAHLIDNAKHIDRVSNLSTATFNAQFGFGSKPAIITDIMSNWPAKTKWTHEYFKRSFSEIYGVAFRCGNDKDSKRFSIADYITYVEENDDSDPYYLRNTKFHLGTTLINDYKIPDYFRCYLEVLGSSANLPGNLQLSWMYIGAKGTFSPLHLDVYNTSAWNAVFSGRKIWAFYPPEQAPLVYNGKVNVFKPDLKAFPRFAEARPIVCVQNPGEVVFTPGGWWHAVYNERGGISLTENFVNDTNYHLVKGTLLAMNRNDELNFVDSCKSRFRLR